MKRLWVFRTTLLFMDIVFLELVFYLTYWVRFNTGYFQNSITFSPAEYFVPSLIVIFYWVIILTWFGLYRIDPLKARTEIALYTVKTVSLGILLLFILTFDPGNPLPLSRLILASYGISLYAVLTGTRLLLQTILRNLRIKGYLSWNTLMVGTGARANNLFNYFSKHPELGTKISSAIASDENRKQQDLIEVTGKFSDFRAIIASQKFDAIVFALDTEDEHYLGKFVKLLHNQAVRVFIQDDQYQLLLGAVKPTAVKGHPIVEIRGDLLSRPEFFFKRVADIVISLMLLVITFPIWLLLCIFIPLESKGKIVYYQKRVGRGGKEFTLLKFRSMIEDAEIKTGAVMTSQRDPRITKTGKIIRPFRLDELPQLFNVLIGQMSLVGPRPERREFVNKFIHEIPLYERRLNVKPGLTGWSQVHIKNPNDPEIVSLKLKYDFFYIENISLPLDVKIMFMTFFVVLRGQGQ